MEHRSFTPDIVVSNDNPAHGNQCTREPAPNVAQEELCQEKQMGGPVNCSDSELCTFLAGLAEGFLPTYYSDISQFAQSKSMSIASRSYHRGKKTVVFHGFQFLQMSRNSTDSPGADGSKSSAEDSHARTLVAPEKEKESTASEADCGAKWPEWFAKWDHDSSSWKTRQCSLLAGLDVYSETWPRWGMMRDGVCSELTMPVRLTEENGSGFWPTPTVDDSSNVTRKSGQYQSLTRTVQWQTPTADDALNRVNGKINSRGEPKLSAQVLMFPTPTSSMMTMGDMEQARFAGNDPRRPSYPTPQARDYFPPHKPDYIAAKKAQGHGMSNLNDFVATPPARDWRSGKASQETMDKNSRPLSEQIGGSLNPPWVEWLMNWPIGWTYLEPLRKDHFDDWKFRTQGSTKTFSSDSMCCVWWRADPSETPYRPQSNEQRSRECADTLSSVPQSGTHESRGLGEEENGSKELRDLRFNISTKEASGQIMQEPALPENEGEIIRRTAVGINHRVDRLKAIGNGQVPAVVRLAWETLTNA